jgi:hypothetical protein
MDLKFNGALRASLNLSLTVSVDMSSVQKIFLGPSTSNVVIASVVTFVAAFVGYNMWIMSNTMPVSSGFENKKVEEGFGGVAVGSGMPDCIRASAEGGQIADFFMSRKSSAEEGVDDLRELLVLLGKLSCFKKDLMGASGVVEATRYQPYSTAHDIEPVAETTARCFAKTIPPRDLAISFDKWSERGVTLLRRLCSEYDAKPEQFAKLSATFGAMIKDVTDVAEKTCFAGTPMINGKAQGREVQGRLPDEAIDLGPYKGRY